MRCSGHPGAIIVVFLVAGGAAHRRQAPVIGPTLDIHQMDVAVVALRGPITAWVAVHASRALQDRRNAIKSCKRLRTRNTWLTRIPGLTDIGHTQGACHCNRCCARHHGPRHIAFSLAMLYCEEVDEQSLT
jgi:hypothetical protein